MKVEIWSDIMCPFCYMGKKKFGLAMEKFRFSDNIDIEWKSFQLQPDLKTNPATNIHEWLAVSKGLPVDRARQMNYAVEKMGEQIGIEFNTDRIVVANTFRAHNLLHYAREKGVQDQVGERLFKAFFSDGKNVDDIPTLVGLGQEFGLNANEVARVLEELSFSEKIRTDLYEARQVNLRGVPHFVFNDKYSVRGAQDVTTFSGALDKAYGEWSAQRN